MAPAPDWRSPSVYAYLDQLDPSGLAWEFLRRNPDYQRDYRTVTRNPARTELSEALQRRWGLRFPVDPGLRTDRAPVVWLPGINPSTVLLAPAPALLRDTRTIEGITPVFARIADDGDYWLIEDPPCHLPIVLIGGATAASPIAAIIPLSVDFSARARAALRFWRLLHGQQSRRPSRGLTQQRHRRLALTLRALDAHLAGETYRAIAQGLFGPERIPAGSGWKTHDLRDRTIRLVRAGIALMRGGYLGLLRGPHHRAA
jgi:hypothetical protein